jgi:hypothetical protein
MGPLPFPIRPPLLPPSPQYPLDHVSVSSTPQTMSFRDLNRHGHSTIFSLDVNRSGLGTSSTANQRSYNSLGRVRQPINALTTPWDDILVHNDVLDSLVEARSQ